LQRLAQDNAGIIDLRPASDGAPDSRRLLLGRTAKLEQLGLVVCEASGLWTMEPDAEQILRDLSMRNDIIKTLHRAMSREGGRFDPSALSLHEEATRDPVIGRLVERGLWDELTGSAYAIIDGVDGHVHHLSFADIDMTGDAKPGAIVELRSWEDGHGETRLSLGLRSDLDLASQVSAPGATWLDRQLLAREPATSGQGFGRKVRAAMDERADYLASQGLARRQGQRLVLAQDLIETLKSRELDTATKDIAERTGLAHKPSPAGNLVSGVFRERVTLSSGRFAMIDDGLSFQLVPWRPALDKHIGQHINGTMNPGGSVDWTLGRGRGIGL
jgi:hypothetical protein